MDRCEHGEKIDRFCASQCCVWREGAGCSNVCMKKYHNHMGPSIIVPERQVDNLLKKYKVENWVKPKVKTLEETIHNYFNCLKIQLNNYIDEVDKKLRTQLCYPYLSKHGIVGVYKKLKKRQYRKVQQKQFRQFYEQTVSLKTQNFANEQRSLYQQQLNKNRLILLQLFKAFSILQDSIKTITVGNINFDVDKNYEQKIRSVFDSISFVKRNTEENLDDQIKQKFEDLGVLQGKKSQKHLKETLDKQKINVPKWGSSGKTTRKKSLDASNDQTKVESSSLHKELQKKASRKSRQELDKMKNQIVNLMSNSKKEQSLAFDLTVTGPPSQTTQVKSGYSESSSRQNIDSKLLPPELNKNFLSVDIKPMNISSSIQSLALSDNKFGSKLKEKNQQNQISQVKHNQLPSQKSNFEPEEKQKKKPSDLKLVVVPFKGDKTLQPSEMSPLLQKRKRFFANDRMQNKKQSGFQLLAVQEESPIKQEPPKSPQKSPKPKTNPQQQKSIQLLTQAVQLKAEDAIPLLKQALKLAPNNLSAAEYLSFLLLQIGNAKQCLRVCNNIHEQLQDQMIYETDLFHINNNRAVALLLLGRYSEAIVGLQKCLSNNQNSLTYKNLGDAYYSIGIYEKAVYNYEKSVSLKPMGETYYNLAVCLFVQQNFHNSLIMAQLAVGLSPETAEYSTLLKEIKSNI